MEESKVSSGDSTEVSDQSEGTETKAESQQSQEVDVEGLLKKNRQLLGEKKKVQEQLREYQSKEKEEKEAKLKSDNQLQELLKLKDAELAEARAELGQFHGAVEAHAKVKAVKAHLGNADIPDELVDLIPLDDIIYDKESKTADEDSAKIVAEVFKNKWGKFFITPEAKGPKLPNTGVSRDTTNFNDLSAKERLKIVSQEMFK